MVYMSSIENYSNYLIYNSGEIYSIRRKKFLKYRYDKDGYRRVDLKSDDKKSKTFFIHQLVAIAYLNLDLSIKNLCVDHIDGTRTNNYLHNLQVITRTQNTRKGNHKKKSGLLRGVYRQGNKFTSKITIDKKTINLGLFETELKAYEAYKIEYDKLMENVIC